MWPYLHPNRELYGEEDRTADIYAGVCSPRWIRDVHSILYSKESTPSADSTSGDVCSEPNRDDGKMSSNLFFLTEAYMFSFLTSAIVSIHLFSYTGSWRRISLWMC